MNTARLLALVVLLSGCGAATPAATTTTTTTSTPSASPKQRLTSAEVEVHEREGAGAGTSGVTGIQTILLNGDPKRAGLYTLILKVPANTRIEAHDHPDDRNATVLSGTWHFGYGSRFDEQALKSLPPGSFYTEPPHEMHFARTGEEPVVVLISGFGPTGTTYASP